VEEPPLLLAMQRIVGRIEVKNDLPRCALMRLQKQVDQKRLDGRRIVADLVVARRLHLLSSNRFNVDLPATGVQSPRRAASLSASIAIIGSCRKFIRGR